MVSPAAISSRMMPFSMPAAADTDNVGAMTVGTSMSGVTTISATVTGNVALVVAVVPRTESLTVAVTVSVKSASESGAGVRVKPVS